MTDVVIRDDAPVSQPVRPIIRIGGETCIAGTTVRTKTVYEAYLRALIDDPVPERLRTYGPLTEEQTQFAIRYEQKKAKRKDPVRRQLKANGRAVRTRGYRAERAVLAFLGDQWERVPMSGALGGRHRGDLRYIGNVRVPAVAVLEVKRRVGGLKFLEKARAQGGGVDGVVFDPANGQEQWFCFPRTTALRLFGASGLLTDAPETYGEPK